MSGGSAGVPALPPRPPLLLSEPREWPPLAHSLWKRLGTSAQEALVITNSVRPWKVPLGLYWPMSMRSLSLHLPALFTKSLKLAKDTPKCRACSQKTRISTSSASGGASSEAPRSTSLWAHSVAPDARAASSAVSTSPPSHSQFLGRFGTPVGSSGAVGGQGAIGGQEASREKSTSLGSRPASWSCSAISCAMTHPKEQPVTASGGSTRPSSDSWPACRAS
mmetsp:Transcript_39530/g.114087  ORF Transcript_39530/g.114087 Transcript_39530/m.114087 type:complete len:221 (-) Transcript_39530:381-1043(-)